MSPLYSAIAVVAASAIQTAPDARFCGGPHVNVGSGFFATLYMFDRSPEYDLEFLVPAKEIKSFGGILVGPDVEVTFNGLDTTRDTTPRIGFKYLDFRDSSGRTIENNYLMLDCGRTSRLAIKYPNLFQADRAPRSSSFDNAFAEYFPKNERERSACFNSIKSGGHFRWAFAPNATEPPTVVLSGRLRLAQAMQQTARIWRSELQNAAEKKCRIIPAPPPPF